MRIRSIKPEFWDSQKLAGVSRDARLTFIGLWQLADDHGRFRAHPAKVTGALFSYDDDDSSPAGRPDVRAWMAELEAAGLIQLYRHEGQDYGFVVGFAEHQKIDNRWASRLPEPPSLAGESKRVRRGSSASRRSSRKRGEESASLTEERVSLTEDSASLANSSRNPAGCELRPTNCPPLEQGAGSREQGTERRGEDPLDGGMDGGCTSYQDGVPTGVVPQGGAPPLVAGHDPGPIIARVAAGRRA